MENKEYFKDGISNTEKEQLRNTIDTVTEDKSLSIGKKIDTLENLLQLIRTREDLLVAQQNEPSVDTAHGLDLINKDIEDLAAKIGVPKEVTREELIEKERELEKDSRKARESKNAPNQN
ncbi:MAG TPA: hypothetical protein VLB02_02080 [Candidatus Paceibacterota bacterium]|nr:hypothetical protein [Candidatus Paceibacterota bacterium]